jgi:hypothetical protein
VVLLVGDITFEPEFVEALRQALRGGSQLLLHQRHAKTLGDKLKQLEETGPIEVLEPWTNPVTGRPATISNDRLAQLVGEQVPVVIEGDPVQYQVNRNRQGWVIELVHNGGVVKKPDQPALVDPQAVAHVRMRPRIAVREARVWGTNQELPLGQSFALTVPPGQSVFVELALPQESR